MQQLDNLDDIKDTNKQITNSVFPRKSINNKYTVTLLPEADNEKYSVTCLPVKSALSGFVSACTERIISTFGRRNRCCEFKDWVLVEMEDDSGCVTSRSGSTASGSRLRVIGDDELEEWDEI